MGLTNNFSWLDRVTTGANPMNPPATPPPPVYDGSAERARNRQSYTPAMRNENARNRGSMTRAAWGSPANYGPQPIDPMEALAALGYFDQGSPGGVRTIDNRPQVRERYDQMRSQAEGRYGRARGDLGQLYDQLASAYQGLPEQAAERFRIASEGGTAETERLIAAATARVNEEAAQRAAQAAELGIDPMEMTELNEAADYGSEQIGRTGANWSGLMGALSTSEQTRGQIAYEGAMDTGVMAKQDLLNRYQDYLQMLDQQESQELMNAIQQVAYSGGTSAAKLPAGIVEALMMESFRQSGILPRDEQPTGPDFSSVGQQDIDMLYSIMQGGGDLGTFYAQGGNPLTPQYLQQQGWTIPGSFNTLYGGMGSGSRRNTVEPGLFGTR
jgi:hypothetical protein